MSDNITLLPAIILETLGIAVIVIGVAELGQANPMSPQVLIPTGSALIAAGSLLWAKVFRR